MSDLIKFDNAETLPRNIGDMTLNELMSGKDVEISKKNNVLKMKRRTSSETVLLEIRGYDDTAVFSQSRTPRNKPVSRMESTIAQMLAEGRTQAEIADILGTTQPNISKIVKKMNANK